MSKEQLINLSMEGAIIGPANFNIRALILSMPLALLEQIFFRQSMILLSVIGGIEKSVASILS